MPSKTRVLFVCLGNICRSPLAEGVFRHLVNERGLDEFYQIDSCGTGAWHLGEPPHPDTRRSAKKNGISLEGQYARQFEAADFEQFDYVLAMDRNNFRDIRARYREQPESIKQAVHLGMFRDFDPEPDDGEVPDPYFGGRDGFDIVFQIVRRTCEALLLKLESERKV